MVRPLLKIGVALNVVAELIVNELVDEVPILVFPKIFNKPTNEAPLHEIELLNICV